MFISKFAFYNNLNLFKMNFLTIKFLLAMTFSQFFFGANVQEGGGYQNLMALEFEKLLKETPDAVLIDVRTASEFEYGYIPKAQNIDWLSGAFHQAVPNFDPSKSYFLYCRSGNRSGQAANVLAGKGFKKVYNLMGGIGTWSGAMIR
jgi:rhodanese-related sulfurtransferase